MRLSRKLLMVGLAIVTCCGVSLIYGLLGDRGRASADELNGQPALDNSLRLESWGECFQSAPGLFLAASSLQADHTGRSGLRRAWRKWHVTHSTAQLMFFLRYDFTASRPATIDEFHANQDVIVDSKLVRQDDLAMLQSAAAWFLDRCPRTPYLLFAARGAAVNPRLVSLHATGGISNGAAARLPFGLPANLTSEPRCLLLHKDAVGLVQKWPTVWGELLSVRGFNASVRDATRLFCPPPESS